MKRIVTTFLLLLCVGVSCSPVNIRHDYDLDADFSTYRTYDWMPQPAPSAAKDPKQALKRNTLLDKRIKRVLDEHLVTAGFSRDADSPDILVAYHTGVEDKIDVTDWGYVYTRRDRYRGRDVDVYRYKEGTLIVDFIDANTKELVWRGVAQGAIEGDRSPEGREQKLDEIIGKMLEKYPPGS